MPFGRVSNTMPRMRGANASAGLRSQRANRSMLFMTVRCVARERMVASRAHPLHPAEWGVLPKIRPTCQRGDCPPSKPLSRKPRLVTPLHSEGGRMAGWLDLSLPHVSGRHYCQILKRGASIFMKFPSSCPPRSLSVQRLTFPRGRGRTNGACEEQWNRPYAWGARWWRSPV